MTPLLRPPRIATGLLAAVGLLSPLLAAAPAVAYPIEHATHGGVAVVAPPAAKPKPKLRPPKVTYSRFVRPPQSTGPVFNDALGSESAQWAVLDTVIAAYDSTPAGATILQSSYTGIAERLARSLLRAHHRGVHVRIVLDDKYRLNDLGRLLRRELGTNPSKRSCFIIPAGASRGSGVMHTKIYATSDAGDGRPAVMVGSSNAGTHDTFLKFNDLFVLHRRDVYHWVRRLHHELTADKHLRHPYRRDTFGRYTLTASMSADPGRDDVLQTLNKIPDGSRVYIAMHLWHEARGLAIARRLTQLRERGVRIHVNEGAHVGSDVAAILAAGDIDVFRADFRNGSVWPHNKYVAVVAPRAADSFVITGSYNFGYSVGDELTLRVDGRKPALQYARNFLALRTHQPG